MSLVVTHAGRPPAEDSALASFVLLAKFLGIPADAEQVLHERGHGEAPFAFDDLVRTARRLGLVARSRPSSLADLAKLPLPALIGLGEGDIAILLKAEAGVEGIRALIQRPSAPAPEVVADETLADAFDGRILLLTTREQMAGNARRFDISWFIPALVKYRKPLRDVLIGSFFLQLMGLASPIFFQLVIDKVLVQHTLSTLDVLAICLGVVLIWETLLSGLRNWLFAHSTNRVDAELSARLFRHLLQLPLSYFEARRVGDSVARVRELERIREFLTSNAVTVVIDLFFSVAKLANWGNHLIQLVSKLTTVAILYWGAKAVIAGDLSVGALVAFNMLAGRVAAPVLRLSQLWQDFQQVRISVDRLGDVLNATAEPEHNPARAALPPVAGRIQFDKVRFRYRPEAPEALRGVDLQIAAGEMIGIVGPSGSGKSTLTKLVQRLYVPGQGRVLIDGVDLALVEPAWLRRQIGVVLQENILFNRTVRENIALINPTMAMERVIEAAQMAGAHEFILALAHGYDTVFDERGANLSGRQRQRIAIARALVGDPRILILDEATSALDAESEEIIQTNLRRIAEGRTVIIIAHRLSAVRQCHRIVTVEAGEVTEEGDHATLIAASGRYADLYRRQMGPRP